MSPRGVVMGAALLCFLIGLLSPAQCLWSGGTARACCLSYSRNPVPFRLIKGYREQRDTDNCRIEAIIFYTTRKTQICASRRDEWVKRVLKQLSSKLNKMSKADEGHLKKSLRRNDGSGLFAPTNTYQTTPSAFISKKK